MMAQQKKDFFPNAGAMYATRQVTEDGIELTWAVNHLAPFLLTTLLLDRLKESAPARIITTASEAHQGAHVPFEDINTERSYRSFGRYGETKWRASPVYAAELARRLEAYKRDGDLLPPGLVASGFQPQQSTHGSWRKPDPPSRPHPAPERTQETLV